MIVLFKKMNNKNVFNVNIFRRRLINWGRKYFRDFPWRETNNPYRILIAETLLHRTQAVQVKEIYKEFIQKFDNPHELAKADKSQVRNLLKSLGLYWRIDLILEMATQIVEDFGGRVPEDKQDLMSLPGVGEYIASSVRCFAYGYPDAIIDTNIIRIVTRVLGIAHKDSLRRNKNFKLIVQQLVDEEHPREYNFALLDHAALICLPKNPRCNECPINHLCAFFSQSSGSG
jgi:A/G-specific adenine glycosylase